MGSPLQASTDDYVAAIRSSRNQSVKQATEDDDVVAQMNAEMQGSSAQEVDDRFASRPALKSRQKTAA